MKEQEEERKRQAEERQRQREAQKRETARKLAVDEQFMSRWLSRKGLRLIRIIDRSSWPWIDEALADGAETSGVYTEKVYNVKVSNGRNDWNEQLIVIYKYNSPCTVDLKRTFDSSVRMGPRGKQQVRVMIKVVCGD